MSNAINEFITNKGKDIMLQLIDSSYWICLLICMLGLIFYIVGSKKSGRVATISFVVYILTQAMKLGLK